MGKKVIWGRLFIWKDSGVDKERYKHGEKRINKQEAG